MARILDNDTRIIDADFGGLSVSATRAAGSFIPTTGTLAGNGQQQLINYITAANAGTGSFIQYQRLNLDFMLKNNEVMVPIDISVQRTSPVPLGFSNNGNNFDQIEEYIYVFTRPLNNHNLDNSTGIITNIGDMENLRSMGLDGAEGAANLSGVAGWPSQGQCIFAEKRMYSYNESLGATIGNGQLSDPGPAPVIYNSLMGMPVLDSVTTWGSMDSITGPNLHVYRIVFNRNQTLPAVPEIINSTLAGDAQCKWPPVSIRMLCKDPNYSEGEYITRLANAMNNIAEGGPTA